MHSRIECSVGKLAVSQVLSFSNYLFMEIIAADAVSESIKMVVSSANRKVCIKREMFERSFMYNINNRGPSIDPWGTPQE